MFERLLGSFPVRALSEKLRNWRLLSSVKDSGSSPVIKLFEKLIKRRLEFGWKKEDGRDPLMELLERSRIWRCSMEPRSEGIEHVSWEFGSDKALTRGVSFFVFVVVTTTLEQKHR
jgi:hypothetical protein